MPIYEYHCHACHNQLEFIQKVTDAPLTDCPKCGKKSLEKVISSTSFRLKGGGWYETDFKNKNNQGKKETSSTTTRSSSEAKSDNETKLDNKLDKEKA
jgi:putative FmdB family regulatory protein